jgi:hypothetical protein
MRLVKWCYRSDKAEAVSKAISYLIKFIEISKMIGVWLSL